MKKTQKQKQRPQPKVEPHCRICGYTPRKAPPGQPDYSWEKVIEHMEAKHPDDVLPTQQELCILEEQEKA